MSDRTTIAEPSKRYRRAAKRYPELLLFPDDAARKAASKKANRASITSRRFWLCAAIITCAGICSYYVLFPIQSSAMPKYLRLIVVLCVYAYFPVAGVAGGIWLRAVYRRSLRLQLQETGIPVCLHCGYDLRGQLDPRCPECGQPFDPALLNRDAARKPPSGT